MDLHTKGLYAVAFTDRQGYNVLLDTIDETGYSARATFLRNHHPGTWSSYQSSGYRVVRLQVVEIEFYEHKGTA